MKRSSLFYLLTFALVLTIGAVGCKKTPKSPTPIPGGKTAPAGGGTPFPPTTGPGPVTGPVIPPEQGPTRIPVEGPGGIPTTDIDTFEGMLKDTNVFKANTVYFEFDRSEVKPGEVAKVQDVANYLKSNPANKLLIEGHCDERGTEEYNRALGERRALAAREVLVRLGIAADRVRTLSYGEDRPAVEGHDEAAYSKNRRDEFILLKPQPQQ
jgi:peptidoglycan-associated lipoprotein